MFPLSVARRESPEEKAEEAAAKVQSVCNLRREPQAFVFGQRARKINNPQPIRKHGIAFILIIGGVALVAERSDL